MQNNQYGIYDEQVLNDQPSDALEGEDDVQASQTFDTPPKIQESIKLLQLDLNEDDTLLRPPTD